MDSGGFKLKKMNLDIQTIIQGGAVGICIFLIILVAFIIKKVFNFMGNHITDNTEALQELKDTMRELKDFLMRK